MCGNNECDELLNNEHSSNERKTLHTKQECESLSASGLGATINDFENDDIIFACIFIHRM